MSLQRVSLLAVIAIAIVPWSDVSAQLPRAGAAERDRGLLGRVGTRREERLDRRAPPVGANPYAPTPAAQAATAQAAAARAATAAGLRGNALGLNPASNPLTQPGLSNRLPTPSTGAQAGWNGNNLYRGQPGLRPTPAPVPQNQARSAYYAPNAQNNVPGAGLAQPQPNLLPEVASNTVPASAVRPANVPPNRLPYSGPGVLIRLPAESRGEVNYLVDDDEHLIVHAGEDQLLRLKGNYEVRFSRGVAADGQSFGEARYTITEGIYRFEVTANGWELYREGEASDVRAAIERAEQRQAASQAAAARARPADALDIDREIRSSSEASTPALLAAPTAELSRTESSSNDSSGNDLSGTSKPKARTAPPAPLPSPAAPVSSEETLPAPKSILEPS